MKRVFISDLHLDEHSTLNNQIFCDLLEELKNKIDELYILGDFFDAWCGDDDDNEFIRQIKKSLKSFSKVAPIYFIWGNHDFGVSKVFEKQTGVKIIPDLTVIETSKRKILLSHGDTFCTLDIAYQKSKRWLQNPIIKWILYKTPLRFRHWLKYKLENKSAKVYNVKPQETYLVVDSSIVEIAKEKGVNVVVHGHTHKPNFYRIKTPDYEVERYEIPDWTDRPGGGYIFLDDDTFSIHIPK